MRIILSVMVALSIMSMNANCSFAEKTMRVAELSKVEGDVQVVTPKDEKKNGEVGMQLTEGYGLNTGAGGFAIVDIKGDTGTAKLEVKENTRLKFTEMIEDKAAATQQTLLDMAIGEMLVTSQRIQSEKSKFEVKTPTSIAGIRGTKFTISVKAE
ncbi:MAG: FecR domain-containing protein [Candidatus Omnitrophica bacterium]|nr:FecR domain-containing protein [Candidatus Omnitrophota bacterium]